MLTLMLKTQLLLLLLQQQMSLMVVCQSDTLMMQQQVASVQLDLADVSGKEITDWVKELEDPIEKLQSQEKLEADINDDPPQYYNPTGAQIASTIFDSATEATAQFGMKGAVMAALIRFSKSLSYSVFGQKEGKSAKERIRQVSSQIWNMQSSLDRLSSQLKRWRMYDSDYDNLHQKIANAMDQYKRFIERTNNTLKPQELDQHAQDFVDYFERNDIESIKQSLLSLAISGSVQNPLNIFARIAKQSKCSSLKLSSLMIQVTNDYSDAAAMKAVVQMLRHGESSAEAEAEAELSRGITALNNIRDAFLISHWECVKDVLKWAKLSAMDSLRLSAGKANPRRSQMLHSHLTRHFSKFSWAVVAIEQFNSAASNFSNKNFIRITDPADTEQEFLIVLSDASDPITCGTVRHARSYLRFTCNSQCSISSSDGIATSTKCGALNNNENWIGSMLSSQIACSPKSCSSHGFCKNHPLLHQPFCICRAGWRGHDCADRSYKGTSKEAIKYIAKIRSKVGHEIRARSAADLHYKLLDMESGIRNLFDNHAECNQMADTLDKQVMQKANYIAEQSLQYLEKKISLKRFNAIAKAVFDSEISLHFWLNQLQNVMLRTKCISVNPTGPCNRRGLLELYKRCVQKTSAICSTHHTTSVQDMKSGIVLLIGKVTQAMMIYHSKDQTASDIDQISLDFLNENFKSLTQKLESQWKRHSCPAFQQPMNEGLENPDLANCSDISSFLGAKVTFTCKTGWETTKNEIECIQSPETPGELQWSQQPRCIPSWSSWSEWSDCSRSCDKGIRSRYRCRGSLNPNCDPIERDTKECMEADCCIVRYGSNVFRCRSNRKECISRIDVCNGQRDCSDGSDEYGCNFLRHGDKISLTNLAHSGYSINCVCTSRCLGWHTCMLKRCHYHPSRCGDIHSHFNIYAVGKGYRQVIHSGDAVGLMYDWSWTNWLSCLGKGRQCTSRSCPGNDVNRLVTHCGGEHFHLYMVGCNNDDRNHRCEGLPIVNGAKVALKRGGDQWLASLGYNEVVDLNVCLRNNPYTRWYGCRREVWKIFK